MDLGFESSLVYIVSSTQPALLSETLSTPPSRKKKKQKQDLQLKINYKYTLFIHVCMYILCAFRACLFVALAVLDLDR